MKYDQPFQRVENTVTQMTNLVCMSLFFFNISELSHLGVDIWKMLDIFFFWMGWNHVFFFFERVESCISC